MQRHKMFCMEEAIRRYGNGRTKENKPNSIQDTKGR